LHDGKKWMCNPGSLFQLEMSKAFSSLQWHYQSFCWRLSLFTAKFNQTFRSSCEAANASICAVHMINQLCLSPGNTNCCWCYKSEIDDIFGDGWCKTRPFWLITMELTDQIVSSVSVSPCHKHLHSEFWFMIMTCVIHNVQRFVTSRSPRAWWFKSLSTEKVSSPKLPGMRKLEHFILQVDGVSKQSFSWTTTLMLQCVCDLQDLQFKK